MNDPILTAAAPTNSDSDIVPSPEQATALPHPDQLPPCEGEATPAPVVARPEPPGPSVWEHPALKAANLQPVFLSGYHYPVLRKIESPLLAILENAGKPAAEKKPEDFTDEQVIELIYVATHDAPTLRALLKEGREEFSATAQREVADVLPLGLVARVATAVGDHFRKAFTEAQETK